MKLRHELLIAGLLIAFCLLNYFYLIPSQVIAEGSSPTYPRLVNTLLIIFSLAYFWEAWRQLRRQRREAPEPATGESGERLVIWRPVAMLLATGVWVLVMEWLGFLLSTFLFLLVAARIFASKSLLKTLALSIIMPLVLYFLFWGLKSRLPEGPLEALIEALIG